MVSMKIADVDFVILDTETTGLSPALGDRMCEIALMRMRRGHTLGSYETLLNPLVPISPAASQVNGITDDMVQDAPLFRSVAPRVLEFLSDSVMIAHNARFDLAFLSVQLQAVGLSFPDIPVVDTLALARRNFDFSHNSLEGLATNLGVFYEKAHRALADVMITKDVFEKIVDRLGSWEGLTLAQLVELQGGPILLPKASDITIPTQIEEALRDGNDLQIRYLSGEGCESVRKIKPLEIIAAYDSVSIVAYCYLRNRERTFRLDRIIEIIE